MNDLCSKTKVNLCAFVSYYTFLKFFRMAKISSKDRRKKTKSIANEYRF